MPHDCATPTAAGLYTIDARGIPGRFRHAAVFGALEALNPGQALRFYNDHDPLSLLAQIEHRFGPRVAIRYVARSPGEIIIDFTFDQ